MRWLAAILVLLLILSGCRPKGGATFEYFNLSTNEIWVAQVVGLPWWASPGRLMPSRAEDQLSAVAAQAFETVQVGKELKIVWIDNGVEGWPGGLKSGQLVPTGTMHTAQFDRSALGVPARLGGTIRFTYLGGEQWRVRML